MKRQAEDRYTETVMIKANMNLVQVSLNTFQIRSLITDSACTLSLKVNVQPKNFHKLSLSTS